ncbi:probable inactive 1-aminocyclopropane-1-carboxylate synthase-like protein 2 [Mizuhopecten yessoensis]|uniref:probable inactive 1-aminocyclopropane-1-carboxylate synthase-like protein 2 n=1 Tax=Mizuhopecten yessoensis TaxID=6573 RepID=UPI000B458607|nr:probable inactive 1-aminocyclopropane-1-carboxylate synthase-like protein 2 [Mizuhopecten yessoensis]
MTSKRAQNSTKESVLLFNTKKVAAYRYDHVTNPRIAEISRSTDCVSKDVLYYYNPCGLYRVRKTFSKFIEEHFKSTIRIKEENIILLDGVAATLNALAFALADVGDVFLCPTPAYINLKYDMLDIGGVDIYEVPMFDGFNVRGVILTSPSNPTGKVYTPHELADLMEFCKREDLHVIFDEIYALSTQGQDCFTSVLSMPIPDPDKTHFIWGLSKDFGLSGFRCGVVYSHDVRVINHLKKMAMFCSIPAPTQMLINGILSDTEWLNNTYFPTYYNRAKETYKLVKDVLDELNIPTAYSCRNVIFFWMDLSQLKSSSGVDCGFK